LCIYDLLGRTRLSRIPVLHSQTIHGIKVLHTEQRASALHFALVLWGGTQVAKVSFEIERTTSGSISEIGSILVTKSTSLYDWVFDLTVQEGSIYAVTAHNELWKIDIEGRGSSVIARGPQAILFSAHAVIDNWKIIIAGGTAFGDILVWSVDIANSNRAACHYIFTGHHGSIFGVQISEPLHNEDGIRRVVSSCSDDRTIRVWNISDVSIEIQPNQDQDTGFGGSASDDVDCLAVTMGHDSRIWSLKYIYLLPHARNKTNRSLLRLLSAGEDATCQSWDLERTTNTIVNNSRNYNLKHAKTVNCHHGKNIWSMYVDGITAGGGDYVVYTGGADAAIHSFTQSRTMSDEDLIYSWELYQAPTNPKVELLPSISLPSENTINSVPKNKRMHFKELVLIEHQRMLAVTNNGRFFISDRLSSDESEANSMEFREVSAITPQHPYQAFEFFSATSDGLYVFMMGKQRKALFYFHVREEALREVRDFDQPVSSIMAPETLLSGEDVPHGYQILLTYLGNKNCTLLHVQQSLETGLLIVEDTISILQDSQEGFLFITSFAISSFSSGSTIAVGSRTGSVDFFIPDNTGSKRYKQQSRFKALHGHDAVTGLKWITRTKHCNSKNGMAESLGFEDVVSVGRDGTCAIHEMQCDGVNYTFRLIGRISMTSGLSLEGVLLAGSRIVVYGFQASNFCLVDLDTQQEIAHAPYIGKRKHWAVRSATADSNVIDINPKFAFASLQVSRIRYVGCLRQKSTEIAQGTHGREMRAIAIGPHLQCGYQNIATGGEDTMIRVTGRQTSYLNEHTTGIQRLLWSSDGLWLLSSGGIEEFCLWKMEFDDQGKRFTQLWSKCPVKTASGDARITWFDACHRVIWKKSVLDSGRSFLLSMVYSNSIIKVSESILISPLADIKFAL
jgi:WD40 repeat protein